VSALEESFAELGRRVVAPNALDHDEQASFDRAAFQAVAEAGLFYLPRDERLASALAGLAAGSGDLGFSVSVVAHLVCIAVIEEHAGPSLKDRVLEGMKRGELLCAVANAEPEAGTDLMNLKSHAQRAPGGFLLSSRKRSITNVGAADIALVSARLAGAKAQEAVNVFLVDTGGSRVFSRPILDLAALRTSPTGDLLCHRAPLPEDALVGQVGDGVTLFRKMFSEERLFCGVLYLAALRHALARSAGHVERRRQFGAPLGANQYVQEKLVKMRVAEDILCSHIDVTLRRLRAGDDAHAALSAVKIFGLEAALEASSDLVRLLGARGIRRSGGAEKLHRDLLGLSILGGTVELHKMIVYGEIKRAHGAGTS
jgi:alkylation response protein AidB-like acyl-CoA dehydrogenase